MSTTCDVALCFSVGNALPHPRICTLNGSKGVLLLSREGEDAVRVLQKERVGTQGVHGKGVFIE